MNSDKKIRLQELAYKWLNGTLTDQEQLEFDMWFEERDDAPVEIPAELSETRSEYEQQLLSKIKKDICIPKSRRLYPLVWRISAAAAAIFIVFGLWLYIEIASSPATRNEVAYQNDIAPGSNKAYLTLANGERILLNDAQNGRLAEQGGVSVHKTADGDLVYEGNTSAAGSVIVYNTIETPKGGQYTLTLPDGSKIWLNAASRVKFPASFAGAAKRRVELSGEAYFQIAKDKKHPFIVATDKQEVEVLGTHFNVNAYEDEKAVKTTLLEGSVKVVVIGAEGSVAGGLKSKILKPGQQSTLDDKGIEVASVELDEAVAWKAGIFLFNEETLESIMKRLARWYDFEVEYKDADRQRVFGGGVSRYDNISKILTKMEKTGGVHFKIEGRKIIVTK